MAEYGQITLIVTQLTFWIGLAKLGVQHASLRTWPEVEAGRSPYTALVWRSTVIFGMLASGVLISLLAVAVVTALPDDWLNDVPHGLLMVLVAGLVIVRVAESALTHPLRALERSASVSTFNVLRRYLTLGLTALVLLGFSASVAGFFGAALIAEGMAVLALGLWMHRGLPASARALDPKLFRTMVGIGLPMVGVELASVLLMLSDRWLIQHYLGNEALGLYGAASTLCEALRAAFLLSLIQTVTPAYGRAWEQQGPAATGQLLGQFTELYAALALPLVAGLAAVAPLLLPMLASDRYSAVATQLPWVMGAMAIESWMTVACAGLMLAKRTHLLWVAVALASLINLALNALLLPRVGLIGASIASMLVLAGLAASVSWAGRRTVQITVPWLRIGLHALSAGWMYLCVVQIEMSSAWLTLLARIVVGIALYGGLTLLTTPWVRAGLAERLFRSSAAPR